MLGAFARFMFIKIYFAAVAAAGLGFLALLLYRCIKERAQLKAEPGNPLLLALYSAALQFVTAFGVSDFSVSIIVYRRLHLVEDEKLPGTLLTACVVPVAVMALGYLTVARVEELTLAVCVLCGIAGAVAGTRTVSRLNASAVRLLMALALLSAAAMMVLRSLGLMPGGGHAAGFHGWRLAVTAAVAFLLSALSMGGFTVSAMLLCFFYAMGLEPSAAFPLAMGTCSIACAFGGIRYVRQGNFSKKLALYSSLFGGLGAFVAVRFVHGLDVTVLQWLITAVALYSAFSLLREYLREHHKTAVSPEKGSDVHV